MVLPPPTPCVGRVLPINPYTGSTFTSAIRYVDRSCMLVVGAAGVVGVVVVVVSSSSSSSTTISPSSSSSVTVSSSKRGRLNCPKASCMVIVPPNPRLDGNNKRTLKLMANAIAVLYLSPKKENWSVIITTNLESLILISINYSSNIP